MRYFFRFIAPTRLTFSSWEVHQEREEKGVKNIYPAEHASCLVFDRRVWQGGFYHHYGLGFDVVAGADDRAAALAIAEHVTVTFMSVLTFLEYCYIGAPQLILSYRYPEDRESRTLEEYSALLIDNGFYQPTNMSLRPVNIQRLDIFFKYLLAATPTTREIIYFALHWMWKAVGNRDKRDVFIQLWVALEILERPLKSLFGLASSKSEHPDCKHCHEKIASCPECGKDLSYTANAGFTGLKRLEGDFVGEKGFLKFNKLHSIRSALVHSGSNVTSAELDSSTFSTRVLINAAILTLLGLSDDKRGDALVMARAPFRTAVLPMMMELRGTALVREVASVDDPAMQPTVEGTYQYRFQVKDGQLVPLVGVEHRLSDVVENLAVQEHMNIDSSQNVEEVWEADAPPDHVPKPDDPGMAT